MTTELDLGGCRVAAVIAVSDMRRARSFYEGTLGLVPGREEGGGAVTYPCAGTSELLVYLSAHAGHNDATTAAFAVPDVVGAVEALTARGVAFERYQDEPGVETDERGIVDMGHFKTAWFRDPDANTIMVVGP